MGSELNSIFTSKIIVEIPDLEKTVRERMNLDVTGHYNRPDVFKLDINKDRN